MNQILSVEMPKKQNLYRNKNSKKADTRTIIIVFCIILIIFALIVGIISFKLLNKNSQKNPKDNPSQVISGTQPTINVEIQEKTLNIIVTHDKQIASIVYNWNDGEKVEQTEIGETTKEIQIEQIFKLIEDVEVIKEKISLMESEKSEEEN